MSFEGISFGKLAIIFIVAGVILVLAIMGSSATNLFSQSVTEDAKVTIKHEEIVSLKHLIIYHEQ
jgi:flagellar basal body-associated protein FliL